MDTIPTRDGGAWPRIGQGTWNMGNQRRHRAAEVRALQLGFDLGMNLVDTAEMYADGGAEEVVGEALQGRSDRIFVVSKVLPENASRQGTLRAAEASLRRLRLDTLDVYLLHWEGPHPLEETLAAFQELEAAGKIRSWGVSNFDADLLARAQSLPGGRRIVANQVLYNLRRRGIERRLLPQCRQDRVVVMAYSPLDQARLRPTRALTSVARRHGVSLESVALAWVLRQEGVMVIPKAVRPEHVRQNAAAADLHLTPEDLAELDRDFPPPDRDVPLETL